MINLASALPTYFVSYKQIFRTPSATRMGRQTQKLVSAQAFVKLAG